MAKKFNTKWAVRRFVQQISPTSLHLTEVRVEGLTIKLEDVSPWIPGITSSRVVGAAAVVDTSNVLYPTGVGYRKLKKVKGKDTDPDRAFYMRQAHSPTFGNKTADIYVKKLTSLQLCARTMWWYQSSKTAKVIWVTLNGAMHMASLQADFNW